MEQQSSSVAVLNDARFGVVRTLKPLRGFEDLYQGENAVELLGNPSVPVAFFETQNLQQPNFTGRHPQAGEPGFDEDLLEYMPVPMGSLIKIWIPQFVSPDNPANFQAYRYTVHWRLTDIAQYNRRLEGQYHLPTEQPGAPDTTLATVQTRFTMPSATRVNLINQPEPVDPFFGEIAHARRELISVRGGSTPAQPLLPASGGGSVQGVYQQGVIDPSVDPVFAPLSAFLEFELIAGGDRMLITADRDGEGGEPVAETSGWNFEDGGVDLGFSVIYGTGKRSSFQHDPFDSVGIYVAFGVGGS